MSRRVVIVSCLLVFLSIGLTVPLGTQTVAEGANIHCEMAAAAGWHHPGLNMWCFYDVVIQLWEAGFPLDRMWD